MMNAMHVRRPGWFRATLAVVCAVVLLASLWGSGKKEKALPLSPEAKREAQLLRRVEANSHDTEAQRALGNLYYDTDRPHMAIPPYLEVLDHHPDDPAVRTDLGTCYKRLGALAQARFEYERVLKSHPDHVQTLFNLAVVAHLEEKYTEAAELWERVVAKAPGSKIAPSALKHAMDARAMAAKKPEKPAPDTKAPSKGEKDE